MAITIRVTPRTIERFVFLIIILVFMSTTIYYSSSSCSTADSAQTEEASAEETKETSENKTTAASTAEKTDETASAEKTDTTAKNTTTAKTTGSTSYKDVEITIAPLRYIIKESNDYKKAVIDTMAFIIKNKMSKDLKGMKVKVYFWDSSSPESWKTYPKITVDFSPIKASSTSTQSLDTSGMIGIGNIDLTKTFKFEFVDSVNETIKTISKTLKIEE